MDDHLSVLALSGSLRRASYNTAILRAAIDLAPSGMTITLADIRSVPHYDEDLRGAGPPPAVTALRAQIQAADALLVATPEYNHGIPGVLKDAIDWVSRPPEQPFDGKPIAILGASPGRVGTARAQAQLRQTLGALNGLILNRPGVLIGGVGALVDDDGHLTDQATRDQIAKLLAALRDWTLRLRGWG